MFKNKRVKLFAILSIIFVMITFFAIQPKYATASVLTNFAEKLSAVTNDGGDEKTISTGSEIDQFGHKWNTVTKQLPSKNTVATYSNQTKTYRLINNELDLRAIDPQNIENDDQLKNLNLDGDYILNADITVDDWTPIGVKQPFTGSLDGAGHQISYTITIDDPYLYFIVTASGAAEAVVNKFSPGVVKPGTFYEDVESDFCFGLFGRLQNATIENLAVNNSIFVREHTPRYSDDPDWYSYPSYAISNIFGGISAIVEGELTTINNCYTFGNVEIINEAGLFNKECSTKRKEELCGGIVGLVGNRVWNDVIAKQTDLIIENCVSKINIKVSHSYTRDSHGGDYGWSKSANERMMLGGIVGQASSSNLLVENCGYEGTLKANAGYMIFPTDFTVNYGGIIGFGFNTPLFNREIIINKCFSNLNVIDEVAGIIAGKTIDYIGDGTMQLTDCKTVAAEGVNNAYEVETYSKESLYNFLNSKEGIDWLNNGESKVEEFVEQANSEKIANVLNNNLTINPSEKLFRGGGMSKISIVVIAISIAVLLLTWFCFKRKRMFKKFKKFGIGCMFVLVVALTIGFCLPIISKVGANGLTNQTQQILTTIENGSETDGLGYTWQTETEITKTKLGTRTIATDSKTYRLIGSAADLDAIDGVDMDNGISTIDDQDIDDEDKLAAIKDNLTKNYRLTSDIDLSGVNTLTFKRREYEDHDSSIETVTYDYGWKPIGTAYEDTYSTELEHNTALEFVNIQRQTGFSGELDGAGYSIKNMLIYNNNPNLILFQGNVIHSLENESSSAPSMYMHPKAQQLTFCSYERTHYGRTNPSYVSWVNYWDPSEYHAKAYLGLFSVLEGGAKITNLAMETPDIYINGVGNVAISPRLYHPDWKPDAFFDTNDNYYLYSTPVDIYCGFLAGRAVGDVQISNCSIINATEMSITLNECGGVSSNPSKADFTQSVCIGGLVGLVEDSTISDCLSTTNIQSNLEIYSIDDTKLKLNDNFAMSCNLGGIAGKTNDGSGVNSCIYKGNISSEKTRNGYKLTNYISGIVGFTEDASASDYYYNTAILGDISARGDGSYIPSTIMGNNYALAEDLKTYNYYCTIGSFTVSKQGNPVELNNINTEDFIYNTAIYGNWVVNYTNNGDLTLLPIQSIFAYQFFIDGNSKGISDYDFQNYYFSRFDFTYTLNETTLQVHNGNKNIQLCSLQSSTFAYTNIKFKNRGRYDFTPDNTPGKPETTLSGNYWQVRISTTEDAFRVALRKTLEVNYFGKKSPETTSIDDFVEITIDNGNANNLNIAGNDNVYYTQNDFDDTAENSIELTENIEDNGEISYTLKIGNAEKFSSFKIKIKDEYLKYFKLTSVYFYQGTSSSSSITPDMSIAIDNRFVDENFKQNNTKSGAYIVLGLAITEKTEWVSFQNSTTTNGNLNTVGDSINNEKFSGVVYNRFGEEIKLSRYFQLSYSSVLTLYGPNETPTIESDKANTGYLQALDIIGYKFEGWWYSENGATPTKIEDDDGDGKFTFNLDVFNESGSSKYIVAGYSVIQYTITAHAVDTDDTSTFEFNIRSDQKRVPSDSSDTGWDWVVIVKDGKVTTNDHVNVKVNGDTITLSSTEFMEQDTTAPKISWQFEYDNRVRDINGNVIYFLTQIRLGSYGNSSEVDTDGNKTILLRYLSKYNLNINSNIGEVAENDDFKYAGVVHKRGQADTPTASENYSIAVGETDFYKFWATFNETNGLAFYNSDDIKNSSYKAERNISSTNYWYAVYKYGYTISAWTIQINFPDELTEQQRELKEQLGECYLVIYKDGDVRHWGIYSTGKGGILKTAVSDDDVDWDTSWSTYTIDPLDLYNQFVGNGENYATMGDMVSVLTSAFAYYGKIDFGLTMTPTWQANEITFVKNNSDENYGQATYDDARGYKIDTQNLTSSGKTFAYFVYRTTTSGNPENNSNYAILDNAIFNYRNIPNYRNQTNGGYRFVGENKYNITLYPCYINNVYKVKLAGLSYELNGEVNYLSALDENASTDHYQIVGDNNVPNADCYVWNALPNVEYHTFMEWNETYYYGCKFVLVDSYISQFFSNYVSRCSSYLASPTIAKNGTEDSEFVFNAFDKLPQYQFKNPRLLLNVFGTPGNYYIYLTNGVAPTLPAFKKRIGNVNYTLNYWTENDRNQTKYRTVLANNIVDDSSQPSSTPTWSYKNTETILTANFYRAFYYLDLSLNNAGYVIVEIVDEDAEGSANGVYLGLYKNYTLNWYTYDAGNIMQADKHWEIKLGEDISSSELLRVYSGCSITLYIGDQSTSPVAMLSGNYDDMIGFRFNDISVWTTGLDFAERSGWKYDENNNPIDTGKTYSYEISAQNIANQNLKVSSHINLNINYQTINYILGVEIDNDLAGNFELSGGVTNANLQDGKLNLNVRQHSLIKLTYNANIGYEFGQYPFVLKLPDGSILPLILLDTLKELDTDGEWTGNYIQIYEFTFGGTWLRQHYYYPVNQLENGTKPLTEQYKNFLTGDAEVGTIAINTKEIEFDLKIKYIDLTDNSYLEVENDNTTYNQKLTITNNKFSLRDGDKQLGLEKVDRQDGVDGKIFVLDYNGNIYTPVMSYAKTFLNTNNKTIDNRVYALPYSVNDNPSNNKIRYFITNYIDMRLNYSAGKILNAHERTLYYVYDMTPLLTLQIVGLYDENDANTNERSVSVQNRINNVTTGDAVSSSQSQSVVNKATYKLVGNQNHITENEIDYWADGDEKLVTWLYITALSTNQISAKYSGVCYSGVEYNLNGAQISSSFGGDKIMTDEQNVLKIKFTPRPLELNVNYYLYTYDDDGKQQDINKVGSDYLIEQGIIDDEIVLYKDANGLFVNREVGFVGFGYSRDYLLTVKLNNSEMLSKMKFDEGNVGHDYRHTIEAEDYINFGELNLDFYFAMSDNSMVFFTFELSGEGAMADDNYGQFTVDLFDKEIGLDPVVSVSTEMPEETSLRVLKGRKIAITATINAGYEYLGYYYNNSISIVSAQDNPLVDNQLVLTESYSADEATRFRFVFAKTKYNFMLDFTNADANGALGNYTMQVGAQTVTDELDKDGMLTIDDAYVGINITIDRQEKDLQGADVLNEEFLGYYFDLDGMRYYAYTDGNFYTDDEHPEGMEKFNSDQFTFRLTDEIITKFANEQTFALHVDHEIKYAVEIVVRDVYEELKFTTYINDTPTSISGYSGPAYFVKGTEIEVRLDARFNKFDVSILGVGSKIVVPNTQVGLYSFKILLNKNYLGENAVIITVNAHNFNVSQQNFVYNTLDQLADNSPTSANTLTNGGGRSYNGAFGSVQTLQIYTEIGAGENRATLKYIRVSGNEFVDIAIVIDEGIKVFVPDGYDASVVGNTITITDGENNVVQLGISQRTTDGISYFDLSFTQQDNINISCEYVDYKTISAID